MMNRANRTVLEKELSEIQEDMLVMADMVARAIERSIDALKNRDVELARDVIAEDLKINNKRYEIEELCLELMATQQPLATDLRTIIAVLHVIVDLERMGDHAEGTAKIAIMLADEPPLKPYVDIPRMAEIATRMLRASLEAFKHRDTDSARQICDEDDEVDALYDQVYRELIVYMINDPKTIERATHVTWVAHNLERIADRVTNICERVVYMVEGKNVELNVSKY
jgi:phosphate transport system protein